MWDAIGILFNDSPLVEIGDDETSRRPDEFEPMPMFQEIGFGALILGRKE
jgi:hypothetical protein